ncbi:MAG: P1 family peptidase [Reyranellaceae bacterium]
MPFDGVPGAFNAITDVPGIAVGLTTLVEGSARTGVTAIVPRAGEAEMRPVWAGIHRFNGNGEMTGSHWIEDGGYVNGPICITNTHSVGIVHHAAVRWMIRRYPRFASDHLWAMPVVAETYDGVINDINGQHVTEAHALAALDGATGGTVPEGNVGGGTGMIAYEFKAGTGTASRRVEIEGVAGTVGVLVQANHGMRDQLTVRGVPVGRHLRHDLLRQRERGSIIGVIATDLPILPHQLSRLARRGALGIGRTGAIGENGSGDLFLAISTANPMALPNHAPAVWRLQALDDGRLNAVYAAAIDAVEEAILNALLAAEDTPTFRPPGRTVRALRAGELVEVLRRYGRVAG